MLIKRQSLKRPIGNRRYKKLFVITVEGRKTEPQYFAMINVQSSVVKVLCLTAPHSSPLEVLARMKNYLKQQSLLSSDEAWLVIDKDEWTDKQLQKLVNWSKTSNRYGLALSNPNFEYWLLLHFEDGNNIAHGRDCLDRLKKHIPNYKKNIDLQIISREMINNAIKRAKLRDKPPCIDWPRVCGGTTVYRLVERILNQDEP